MPETLEELVDSHMGPDEAIVVGRIVDVLESGQYSFEHEMSADEIQYHIDILIDESRIDIEREFGPSITPSPTQIIGKADAQVLDELFWPHFTDPATYTTYSLELERVLYDGTSLVDADTLAVRDVHWYADDEPLEIGHRYMLMLYREDDGVFETGSLGGAMRLGEGIVTNRYGVPHPFAQGLTEGDLLDRVAGAVDGEAEAGVARSGPGAPDIAAVVGAVDIVAEVRVDGIGEPRFGTEDGRQLTQAEEAVLWEVDPTAATLASTIYRILDLSVTRIYTGTFGADAVVLPIMGGRVGDTVYEPTGGDDVDIDTLADHPTGILFARYLDRWAAHMTPEEYARVYMFQAATERAAELTDSGTPSVAVGVVRWFQFVGDEAIDTRNGVTMPRDALIAEINAAVGE